MSPETIAAPAAARPLITSPAADSLAAIDAQVAAVLALSIPPDVQVGSLQQDVQNTQNEAKDWTNSLRGAVSQALEQVVSTSTGFASQVAAVGSMSQDDLTAFIQGFQQQVGALANTVSGVGGLIGNYRACLDACSGALATDLKAVNQQITTYQQQEQNYQAQMAAQQAKIAYYESHPWLLVLAGLTIAGLVAILVDMQEADAQISEESQQIAKIEQALAPLLQTTGPVTMLMTGVTYLTDGLLNLHTAVVEASNTLDQITDLTVARAIIEADVETVAQSLDQAATIANQVLGNPS